MTSEECETLRIEKLKELNADRERINLALEKRFQLQKELLEINETIRMGKHLLAIKKTEIEVLTAQYWKSKQ